MSRARRGDGVEAGARAREPRDPDVDRHRRRVLVRTLVAVAVTLGLVVGGPWLYARLVADDAAAPLVLSTPTPSATPTEEVVSGPFDPEGAWTVGEGSQAGYRLGEILSGEPVTVVGRTDQVSGEALVEAGTLTEARVVVDVASIVSDESARDAFFRRALDVTTHPEATFVLDAPVDLAALVAGSGPVDVAAPGTLTFHGVSQPVVAELRIQRVADGVEVAGSVPVALADFGLEAPDLGFVTVEPTGTVELLLHLVR